MKLTHVCLAACVTISMITTLTAQDGPKKGGRGAGPGPGQSILERLESLPNLNLTDDQKAKLKAVKKEYGPKIRGGLEGVRPRNNARHSVSR